MEYLIPLRVWRTMEISGNFHRPLWKFPFLRSQVSGLRIHRIHAAHLSYTWYFRKRVYPSVSLRMLFMYFRAWTARTQDQSRPVAKGSRHNCLYANIGWTYVCTSSRRPSCSASSKDYHFKHFLAKYNLKSVKCEVRESYFFCFLLIFGA